jgi:hypothetical protein
MAIPFSDAGDAEAQEQTFPCRRCGKHVRPGRGDLYVVSILAVADPSPPVFTEDDLALDAGAEILRLTAKLNDLGALEAENEVYRRLVFHLCGSCYQRWIKDPTGTAEDDLVG